jgi:hypothetical protein
MAGLNWLAHPGSAHNDVFGGAFHEGFEKESRVRDLVFTLVTIGFFFVAIGYLRGCERLK